FKEETIQRFCEYYQEIVTAVAGNTGIKLKEIKISHDLGVAQSTVLEDEDDEFGF
ncbi:MAG: hypothetical protein GY757_13000, partial [bacterium]|nr:hypothetical protein [bacterium]